MPKIKSSAINMVLLIGLFFLADHHAALSMEPPKIVPSKEKHIPEVTGAYADMEWEGNLSDQKEKFVKIVMDKPEWDDIWKRAFGKSAPEIDFENYAIACVFLGHDADWLYDISFATPFKRDNVMVIPFGLAEIILRLSGPFKASGQYHMKVVKKQKGFEMLLEDSLGSLKK